MRGLATALGLFTIIPAPVRTELDRAASRRAILAFPWLGALLGLAGALAAGVFGWRLGPGLLPAMLALAVPAVATGAMHLDGLADTFDGLGSRRPPEEALAIMKRSDIGPMGVAAIVLVLLLDAAVLAHLPLPWLLAAAVLGPLWGRLGTLLATVEGVPGGRPGGFGSLFAGVTPRPAAALAVAAAAALGIGAGGLAGLATGGWLGAVSGGAATVAALAVSVLANRGWRAHLLRRLGGMTGDTFGSMVEIGQLAGWLVLALLVG